MNWDDDPACGSEDSPQGPIYVPRGPVWDAWNASDGGAVQLAVQAMKMEARWLRRARPRPFGFAPDSAHPAPERIGQAHGAGTLSSGVATMLGFRTAVRTMSMRYGDVADPVAPTAEVISDFHREYQDRDLEEMLRDAPGTRAGWAQAPGAVAADEQAADSRAQVASATIDVIVSGRRRPVAMLRLRDFSAFQVGEDGVLVTVFARHIGPQFPEIVRLTDLEPMLSEMENPDPKRIAAALAESRRQHVEQMRHQNRHSS